MIWKVCAQISDNSTKNNAWNWTLKNGIFQGDSLSPLLFFGVQLKYHIANNLKHRLYETSIIE